MKSPIDLPSGAPGGPEPVFLLITVAVFTAVAKYLGCPAELALGVAWSLTWPRAVAFLRGGRPYPGQVEEDPVREILAAAAALPGAHAAPPAVRLDQPDLVPVGGPPAPAPAWGPGDPEMMVRFRDGSWQLCRVTGRRQRDDGAWLVELRWGIAGRIVQGRYIYDRGKAWQGS